MSSSDFCTCADHSCPFNPVNHDKGCNLCILKCLKANEIPSCFFKKLPVDLSGNSDWSFDGFAKLVKGEIK